MLNLKLYNNQSRNSIKIKSFMKVFLSIVSQRSMQRYRHYIRVSMYASILAETIGMQEKQIKYMEYAGLLHDAGLIAINDNILDKPAGLTSDEYNSIKLHPCIGMQLADCIGLHENTVRAVVQHHETYNGEGYPAGLKAEKISVEGRILFISEVFDAITNDSPYRKEVNIDTAIAFLNAMAGKKFDPMLVDLVLNSEKIAGIYARKDNLSEQDIALSF